MRKKKEVSDLNLDVNGIMGYCGVVMEQLQ
jgi:hypothetical protein